MNQTLIITGATASGKSSLALAIAQERGGVVINADSMQLYVDAPIITAQPNAQEMAQAEHRLYGVRDAADACSVAAWVAMAVDEIRDCWRIGALPILVGGTGMYLKALMEGISAIPEIPDTIREEVRALEGDALYAALAREDAIMAAKLHASDSQRSARALEVMRATGKSLAYWYTREVPKPLPEAEFQLVVTQMPREQLYGRINQRFEQMIGQGALEEAQRLHTRGLSRDLPLLRAVGVAELLAHLDGTLSLEEAIESAQTHSRRYAKRQLTWVRHQFGDATQVDISDGVQSALAALHQNASL